jgi:hypothetical protein
MRLAKFKMAATAILEKYIITTVFIGRSFSNFIVGPYSLTEISYSAVELEREHEHSHPPTNVFRS